MACFVTVSSSVSTMIELSSFLCCYCQKRTPDLWDSWFQGFSLLIMGLISCLLLSLVHMLRGLSFGTVMG